MVEILDVLEHTAKDLVETLRDVPGYENVEVRRDSSLFIIYDDFEEIGQIFTIYGQFYTNILTKTRSGLLKSMQFIHGEKDLKDYIDYLRDEACPKFDSNERFWLYQELMRCKENGELFDWREITRDQLEELSWCQNLSDSHIGNIYGVNYKTVCKKRGKMKLQLHNSFLANPLNRPNDIVRISKLFPCVLF